MGNTLRVLGIIVVAMVLGLTSLVVVLFTICGGLEGPSPDAAMLLGVALVVLVGGVAAIVWLGRGIVPSRPHGGLAIGPTAGMPHAHTARAPDAAAAPGNYAAPAPVRSPATRREPLAGSDLQMLVLLRVVIGVSILASLAMAAMSFSALRATDPTIALRIFIPAFIGVMPPALALVLLLGNPPPGAALDLAIGTSVASLLLRLVSIGRLLSLAYGAMPSLPMYLGQMGLFTLADIAIVALALLVRRRVDPGHPGRMAAMILGFLAWEWLVQMVAMLAY